MIRLGIIFAVFALSRVVWGIAFACIAHRVEAVQWLHRADYRQCVTIHNGPIQRPDHFGKPFQRQKDVA
jgi:hypothetical protein